MSFLDRHLDALRNADADAIAALYADAGALLSLDYVRTGRDAIREQYEQFFAFHGSISDASVKRQQAGDDAVFAEYALTSERGTFRLLNAFTLEGDVCHRHFSNEVSVSLDADEVQR
jgi:ketosteroid isomerase-like protein